MEKRFIFGSFEKWNLNKGTNEENYFNSIVFITETGNDKKGTMIYTHGAYFEMNNTADVENIIKNFLNGKGTGNINVVVDESGNLTISETSIASLTGKKDSAELVQAKAVAGALTEPFKLSLTVDKESKKGQFTQHFKTLNGDDATFASAIIEAGDGLTIEQTTEGLKLSADLSNLKEGLNYGNGNVITVDNENRTINHNEVATTTKTIGTAINPTSDAKTFDIKSYGFDKYGHIASETTTTVTLPDNAFKNDNTTYDLNATANATKGVDVNLQGNDTTTDTVTFVGGSNVEVALVDGKVEISSSYVNDNTTYAGENAIVVDQPEEGKTEGKVSLKIAEGEKFLSQDANGLKSTVEVKYNSATNYIYLEGANGSTTGFDASAFVKDSFVESVTYVDQDDKGKTGKFLKFVFVVVDQDGQEEFEKTTTTTYVDVTELINTIYDVKGDTATYSVVEEYTKEDGTVLFTVKNTIGSALVYDYQTSNANTTVTISNPNSGLVDTEILTSAISNIKSDKLATEKLLAENKNASEGEIAVVTGIHQDKGHIVSVDADLAATKTYVDNKFGAVKHNTVSAPKAEGEENYVTITPKNNADGSTNYEVVVSGIDNAIATATKTGTVVNQGTNGTYNFVNTVNGLMTAEAVAELMNEAWAWDTI